MRIHKSQVSFFFSFSDAFLATWNGIAVFLFFSDFVSDYTRCGKYETIMYCSLFIVNIY